jgi:hypothetical protein
MDMAIAINNDEDNDFIEEYITHNSIFNVVYLHPILKKYDPNKVFELCKKHAKNKNKYALNNVGEFYYNGECCDKDLYLAFTYFKELADIKFMDGMYNRAFMYLHRFKFTDKSNNKDDAINTAVSLLHECALQNHRYSIRYLAIIYMSPLYKGMIDIDYQKAYNIIKQGIALNMTSCTYYLGNLYEKGIIVEKNDNIALEHYTNFLLKVDDKKIDDDTLIDDCIDKICDLYTDTRDNNIIDKMFEHIDNKNIKTVLAKLLSSKEGLEYTANLWKINKELQRKIDINGQDVDNTIYI